MKQRPRSLSPGTDRTALRFLEALTSKFPSFIGEVTDTYEIRMRLDDVLAHRNMGPDTVRVESMSIDRDAREFRALCVPQDGCSMLRLTHIGVPVPGTRDGYLFKPSEIAQVTGLQPEAIKSCLPVVGGMMHIELITPIVMSAKVPPDQMRSAMARVCQAAEQGGKASDAALTETEIALQNAERGLEAEVIRLRGKGKGLIEIESLTAGLRETVQRLKQECDEERSAGDEMSVPPSPIVNPDAPFAKVGDGMTVTGVQQIFHAWLTAQELSGVTKLSATEIYGTAIGVSATAAHVRVKDDTGAASEDRADVILGHVIEHTLMQCGWIGHHEGERTVWLLPQRKQMQDAPPQPAQE